MPHPLYIAFIWHQHQPLYKSLELDDAGLYQYRLPWVRLHGTKDYLDLILLLERYPQLHQTVNLVPSLILQIEDYVSGRAMDPYLALALTQEENLSSWDKRFIVDHFFDANHHTLIDPHPRYAQLYEQRQEQGKEWCLEHWQAGDYGDLLAWHNLAWIDPLFWDDPVIAGWLQKGQGFNLSDRQAIYTKQREILSRILPQHKKMQDAGQLEVTTTPYTHPIMPLLADTNAGRVAIPQMQLPHQRFQWAEDIPRHLQKSWQMYQKYFGRNPRGLWPSEQSVSPEVLSPIREAGFQWICSDEAVLGWTIKQFFHRDSVGTVYEPELLYQPYRLATPHGDLAIVFRDHRLSDLIGFSYGGMDPYRAARDLVGHLDAIARTLGERQTSGSTALESPWLVNIALDGENCWEFYDQDGKLFLETLYSLLSDRTDIKLVTVSEYLEEFPPTATLPSDRLHSGSWVDGSFTTWIGDPAKNKAWDLLAEARQVLANHPEATEEANPQAWEALYAAEGSDWFWWFGYGHSSNQDAIFDQLFREHLMAIYTALGEPVPEILQQPVEKHEGMLREQPQGFIQPVINGLADEQDWNHAGRLDIGGDRGTMHQSSPIQRVWYGVDHLHFYVRIDFQVGINPKADLANELHLLWFYSDRPMHNSPPSLTELPDAAPLNYFYHHHLGINLQTQASWLQEAIEHGQWVHRSTRARIGLQECLEVSVPWQDLQIEPDYNLKLLIIQADHGIYQGYLPDRLINLQVP